MPYQGLLMKKISTLLIACLASLGAQAESPLNYDLNGQYVYTQVKSAGETFSPRLFQVKAGVSLKESLLAGIGIQGQYATPIDDSTKGNLTLDIKSQSGVFITLADPNSDPESLKFMLLLGYGSTKLETLDQFDGKTSDTFSGFAYGFSFQQRIFPKTPLSFSLDCTRHYRDSHLRIDGCGVGASYAF
jgi:hypothetical protein